MLSAKSADALQPPRTISPRWATFALLALTLVAYLPALQAGFIWDDEDHVYRSLALRSAAGLWRLWTHIGEVPQYYPLTHTSFWIEHQLWGNAPFGYHLVNILIHSISAILLWRALRMLSVPGAFLAAALFAVHPVHVESVAWITERKNVLSGFFYLLAFITYWRAIGEPDEKRSPTLNRRLYISAIALFICALLSKTVTSTLPAAILLALWWKRGRLRIADIALTIPLFVVGACFGLLTSWMEHHIVGAYGPDWEIAPQNRLLIAGRAIWFYLEKLVWPANLTFIYPQWKIDAHSMVQWLFPIAAVGAVLVLYFLRNRIGRGPLVALLFFGGTLMPALGFFNTFPMRYSYVADHFQYLASIGVLALIAALLATHLPRRAIMPAGAAILIILASLTFRQTFSYADLRTLWRDTLEKNPRAWMAAANLAKLYMDDADAAEPSEKTDLAKKALALLDQAETEKRGDPLMIILRGFALHQLGQKDEALKLWNSIEQLEGKVNPQVWPTAASLAQFQLGRHYHLEGDLPRAEEHYRRALSISPVQPDAATQLAAILSKRGDLQEAWNLLQRVTQTTPDSHIAWTNMGNLLMQAGRPAEALDAYKRAAALKPGHIPARYGAAIALASSGQLAQAEQDLRSLLNDHPDLPDALASLGTILAKTNRPDEARPLLQRALELQPNHAQAQRQLQQLPAR